jgi:hypothetical protein
MWKGEVHMLKTLPVVAAFLVGAVISLAVVGLGTYVGVGLGEPQPGRQLVSSGVQSVTNCEKHDTHIMMDSIVMEIPGVDVGLWAPEKQGDCHVWYHYTDAEE